MAPPSDVQRRLESTLNDDVYTCEKCCHDLPYSVWNTCPLCVCGLMPVVVVCFSALFRLDYATHVTDIGAKIINEMGLSYTVYYTAGCWPDVSGANSASNGLETPEELDPQQGLRGPRSIHQFNPRCNTRQFEIAAGEFDALSGSLLKVRNVTQLHARRVEAVKVSPDWRYIVFVGALANDIGNLYAVGAEETNAQQAVPLLGELQLDALDNQCQKHSRAILELGHAGRSDVARFAGVKHLQVIIPDAGDAVEAWELPPGSSPLYRAAFAFECALPGAPQEEPLHSPGILPLRFSQLAVVDFALTGLHMQRNERTSGASDWRDGSKKGGHAKSELFIIDAATAVPEGSNPAAREAIERFQSQSCPRFVPSLSGTGLLFVAEDLDPEHQDPERKTTTSMPGVHFPSAEMPSRRLGTISIPLRSWRRTSGKTTEAGSARRLGLPGMCCKALTATCLACVEQISVEEYCSKPAHANAIGCEPLDKAKACCGDATAECLACHEGKSKEEFCKEEVHAKIEGCSIRKSHDRCCQELTAECMACREHKSVAEFCKESDDHMGVQGCEHVKQDHAHTIEAEATFLNIGLNALPFAPVRGCPEFVPTLYFTTPSLAETFKDRLFKDTTKEAEGQPAEEKLRDTFVILSHPTSRSVLGVHAQVLAVSLPEGAAKGDVSHVQLLYDVGSAPGSSGGTRLRLGGCQPIRAAGRQGHMRLQSALETLMTMFQLHTDRSGYTAWLACLTADQRIAIVESQKRENWINMSMPYPMWTGKPMQAVWCPPEREEACFEVWSNPNPNE